MIAGSLARIPDPLDEPLESWYNNRSLPALEVETTQDSFDDRPIQKGTVATRVERSKDMVEISKNASGEPDGLVTDSTMQRVTLATEWVADVTGTGLIVPASTDGDDQLDFPFDVFWNVAGHSIERLEVDVHKLHERWDRDDVLGEVWMAGDSSPEGTSIEYDGSIDETVRPTIGLGFERPWNGYAYKGVIYESGYVAVYDTDSPTQFIRFVEEEILPYVREASEDEEKQATLGRETCDECGSESDNLEEHGDDKLCPNCLEDRKRETERYATQSADGGDA